MKQELDFLADFVREECAKAVDEHGLTAQGLKNIKTMVRSMLQLHAETKDLNFSDWHQEIFGKAGDFHFKKTGHKIPALKSKLYIPRSISFLFKKLIIYFLIFLLFKLRTFSYISHTFII